MEKAIDKFGRIMLLLGLMCIFLVSCSKSKEEAETEESFNEIEEGVTQFKIDEEEPLVVFYQDASLGNQMPIVLHNFILQHPEINLLIYNINSKNLELETMERIKQLIKQYGDSDIWLLDAESGEMKELLDDLYDMGMIADISSFYAEDQAIQSEDYVGGTFEVLKNEEALLGIPLSWSKECLIIRDSKWKNSEWAELPKEYTGEELYRALISQFEKGREEDELFWADESFNLLYDMYELEVLEYKNNEYFIDEKIFEMIYEFGLKQVKQDRAAEKQQSIRYDQFQGCAALDPYMYSGNYFGCSLYEAPQIAAIYTKSMFEMIDEEVHIYYMPTFESSDQYVGRVQECAMVGGNSARKQQAYEVIRMMMDTPITMMTQPEGYVPETYSPVNVELALQMVDDFDEIDQRLSVTNRIGELLFNVEKQKLTEDEKQQLYKVISKIENLYLDDGYTEIDKIYYSYVGEYVNHNGSLNTKLCYLELMRAMNPESEKWNMTPEEIEAFVNEE